MIHAQIQEKVAKKLNEEDSGSEQSEKGTALKSLEARLQASFIEADLLAEIITQFQICNNVYSVVSTINRGNNTGALKVFWVTTFFNNPSQTLLFLSVANSKSLPVQCQISSNNVGIGHDTAQVSRCWIASPLCLLFLRTAHWYNLIITLNVLEWEEWYAIWLGKDAWGQRMCIYCFHPRIVYLRLWSSVLSKTFKSNQIFVSVYR